MPSKTTITVQDIFQTMWKELLSDVKVKQCLKKDQYPVSWNVIVWTEVIA